MSLHTFRSALALTGSLVSAVLATGAAAQSLPTIREPLSDTNCGSYATVALPACTTTGTRTNTTPAVTVTAASPTTSTVTHVETVTYSGDLQVAGRPITFSGPAFTVPATAVFDPNAVKVNVDANYTGRIAVTVPNANVAAAAGALSVPQALFQNYTFNSLTTNSIDVAVEAGSITDIGTGETYTYDLSSVDPTAITNNSTALTGVYRSDPTSSGAIVFGTISGTATLVAANGNAVTSPAPILLDADGNPTGGWASPFGLDYALAAVETTRLDETGLTTPKVEVTQGIEMNGSKITGLAAGTAATDAVNKGQLDAEATTRQNVDLELTQRIATEENARAALAGALNSETNARLAADLGLQNQIGALGNRVGNLEAHVAELDDRVASSTAIAVAMGGATFLPGMKFNLTANVATYDGAHAGSLQVGALVSDHVAVNAGVATGFNRRGKTAGRVGVTFGW
mgnify:CR=1 FL=1